MSLNNRGFVAVFFDIPFPTSIPNGMYLTHDPRKDVACVTVALKEGSKAFFRSQPIIGPNSFQELHEHSSDLERPREDQDYLMTSVLPDDTEKATLNIRSGDDGGYVESKYYSHVCVTFLTDNLDIISQEGEVMARVFEVLNPFLDKYRLLNEDYRVGRVSLERHFYCATCHTSALTPDEITLSPSELFKRLEEPRTFLTKLGDGAANILRINSFELLGPRAPMVGEAMRIFCEFVREDYEMSLSYNLILEAIRCLQKQREYRLAIIHAETAFETYVTAILVKLLVDSRASEAQASAAIENDRKYWGIKRQLSRLDELTEQSCIKESRQFSRFVDSSLFSRWEVDLYRKRNAAVHSGVSAFSYDEAWKAIGAAKECIVKLEARTPTLGDKVQLNPSMGAFRENAGEVMF